MASRALNYISNQENDELKNGYKDVIEELDMMIKSIKSSERKRNRQ